MAVRTTLFATDHHQSPLRVLTADDARRVVFSPFGYHAPVSGVLAAPGFNGERLDPLTGCYLLGNGYRAYNPALCRFYSPDSLSPFQSGGVNPYAYCAGEPINRIDPSGHFWRSFVRRISGLFSSPQGPMENSYSKWKASYKKQKKPLTDFRKVGEGAFTFDDIYKGKRRLNLLAHGGVEESSGVGMLKIDGQPRDAEWVAGTLREQGTDFKSYEYARILACRSADNGNFSFGHNFNWQSGLATKAYQGPLTTSWHGNSVMSGLRGIKGQRMTKPASRFLIAKDDLFNVTTGQMIKFNFKSVRFGY